MNKRLIIFIYLISQISLSWGGTQFEAIYSIPAGEYTDIADQVISIRFDPSPLSEQKKYNYLKELQQRLDQETHKNSKQILLWFLTGLNQNNLAETRYLIVLNQEGQHEANKDIQVSDHNIARSRAYDNAIRLDSAEPHQLSSAIYATMGYGLSDSQRIKTYSRELKLGISSENESNEWFLHWAKIAALVHEKRLDEAQAALTELKTLLEKKGKKTSSYKKIVTQAESQVKKSTQKSENRKTRQKILADAKAAQKAQAGWTWKTWVSIAIGVFITGFVIAVVVFYRLRKKSA